MINTLNIHPHPLLLTLKSVLASPRVRRALLWLGLFALTALLLTIFGDAHAQATTPSTAGSTAGFDINGATNATAVKGCNTVKSLTENRWLKVLLVGSFLLAVFAIFTRNREGYGKLAWAVGSVIGLGIIWQVAAAFGFSC